MLRKTLHESATNITDYILLAVDYVILLTHYILIKKSNFYNQIQLISLCLFLP